MTCQRTSVCVIVTSVITSSSVAGAARGMRWWARALWVMGYHAVLAWQAIVMLDSPDLSPSLWFVALAFFVGVAVFLQAWSGLPAVFHGLCLLVVLPGAALVVPSAFPTAYEQLVMTPEVVVVQRADEHVVNEMGGGRYVTPDSTYSYTDISARRPGGDTLQAIARPRGHFARGAAIRVDTDPLGLVRAQHNTLAPVPLWFELLALAVLAVAEVELASALVRPPGRSVIAASGSASVAARA